MPASKLRFGYWTPIFGGWLRNVEDEDTPVTFEHVREIARPPDPIRRSRTDGAYSGLHRAHPRTDGR